MRENEGMSKRFPFYAQPVACYDQAGHLATGHCVPLSRWMLKWFVDHVILLAIFGHVFVVLVTNRDP